MKPDRNIETSRLILKPTTTDDAEFIFALVNSPKWLKYIGDRNVKTIADALVYIKEKIRPQQIELGYSNYTVIRKSDRAKIGSCGLYKREELSYIDIGFAFLPEYEKLGYGFESAQKILNAAFNTFHLKKVCAITTLENLESQQLLVKIGMKYIREIISPNTNEKLMYYEQKNPTAKQ